MDIHLELWGRDNPPILLKEETYTKFYFFNTNVEVSQTCNKGLLMDETITQTKTTNFIKIFGRSFKFTPQVKTVYENKPSHTSNAIIRRAVAAVTAYMRCGGDVTPYAQQFGVDAGILLGVGACEQLLPFCGTIYAVGSTAYQHQVNNVSISVLAIEIGKIFLKQGALDVVRLTMGGPFLAYQMAGGVIDGLNYHCSTNHFTDNDVYYSHLMRNLIDAKQHVNVQVTFD